METYHAILKLAATSLLIATAPGAPARADLLGSVGAAVDKATSDISNNVDDVASAVGSPSGNAGASASAGASGTGTGGQVNVGVGLTVANGVPAPHVCVGMGLASICGTAEIPTLPGVPVNRNAPSVSSASVATHRGGASDPAGTLAPTIGMLAIGSDGEILGMIEEIEATEQGGMPMITVQLDRRRRAQLRNAISSINDKGVWLVVAARAINDRANGRLTRLAIH